MRRRKYTFTISIKVNVRKVVNEGYNDEELWSEIHRQIVEAIRPGMANKYADKILKDYQERSKLWKA